MISVSKQVRSRALGKRSSFLRVADFAGIGSHAAVRQALSRLAREGELIPIREGLYWRGRKTRFGMSRPDAIQIAEAVVGKGGVGYAGVSAANALGLTSQVPGVAEIAVPVRAPESLGHARFVSRAARSGRRATNLNALEVSLLETLEQWDEVVEESYSFAVSWIRRMLDAGDLDAEKLVKASNGESVKTRVRLKQLLKDIGRPVVASTVRGPSTSDDRYVIAA